MLTKELIQQNEVLSSLNDDQVTAIVQLSENKLGEEIGNKTGEFWGRIDEDLKQLTGKEKPQGTKTHQWMKEVYTGLQTAVKEAQNNNDATELQSQLDAIKKEKKELERQVKDGDTSPLLKRQISDYEQALKDKENEVSEWKQKYQSDSQNWEQKLNEALQSSSRLQQEYELNQGLSGLTFVSEKRLTPEARNIIVDAVKSDILRNLEMVEIEHGNKKVVAFRDKSTQKVLTNPKNNLNPYTAKELLQERLSKAGVLDTGHAQNGTGTSASGGGKVSLDLIGVSTQVQADDQIRAYLMAEGVQRGTPEFNKRHKEIREQNGVSELPVR